jgi:RNA polymerase sigma-70 factor, ECF subfamily
MVGEPIVESAASMTFDDVFLAQFSPLVRAITVICGDRELARDCVQEAFVRAHARWSKIGRYDDPGAWVRHVALNLVRDHERRRVRGARAKIRLIGSRDDVVAGPEPPSDLGELLDELTVRQREVLALHYVEGLSVAEVAATLGLSDGAVKFHLHAGRERLRPLVSAWKGDDDG